MYASLEGNLFEPLSPDALSEYNSGDGRELGNTDGNPGKMQALHSSSALCCNVFHYWRRVGRPEAIARACGVPHSSVTVAFEQQLPIDRSQFRYAPNLDAVFRYDCGPIDLIGVESKFCEPFSTRGHPGLKAKYTASSCAEFWREMPALRGVAEQLCPDNRMFRYLDAAQLLKHILGLKRNAKRGFRLLYLYYDVPGRAGVEHCSEIEQFIAVANRDGIVVSTNTYQDVILRLLRHGHDEDALYLNYISERYL
jgi:hypothetical protein